MVLWRIYFFKFLHLSRKRFQFLDNCIYIAKNEFDQFNENVKAVSENEKKPYALDIKIIQKDQYLINRHFIPPVTGIWQALN